jgi:ubiquinone/menaquinone biosynthesis C-methylase UbiE
MVWMDSWDDKYKEGGRIWGDEPSEAARRFVESLPEDTKYILDVGCGYGRDAIYFASRGYQVTGVDPSRKAVEMAFASVTDPKMNIEFFQDDVLALSFPSANVDAVWCANLLHLLDDEEREKAISEMVRVLKPGGILGIYTLSAKDKSDGEKKTFTQEELEVLLSDLDIVALEEMDEEEIHSTGETHHHVKWLAVARKR